MNRHYLKIDDSLIISRIQQKELLHIKPDLGLSSQYSALVTKVSFRPFADELPIDLGLDLLVIGSRAVKLGIDRGYFHHGLEKLLSSVSPCEAVMAMGRIHRTAPIFYQVALMFAFEELYVPPKESTTDRRHFAIALEYARVFHHLETIRNLLWALDFDSLAELLEQCELALVKQKAQFLYIFSSNDESPAMASLEEVLVGLMEALQTIEEFETIVNQEEKVERALAKKAIISSQMAGAMGLTGPYLRANRNFYDLRHQERGQLLYKNPPKLQISESGDAFSRLTLRFGEIKASLKWLKDVLLQEDAQQFFLKPIKIDADYCQGPPKAQMASGEIEGTEGDIKISIFVNSLDGSQEIRVRSPAYYIAQAIPMLCANLDVSDLPILLYSLGIFAEEIDK